VGLPAKEFETAAVERLTAHDWPGNIRELKNAVERLLILAPGPAVTNDVEKLVGRGDVEEGRVPPAKPAVMRPGCALQHSRSSNRRPSAIS
jgi:DNA-binding NtrC family response regulator